MPAAVPRRARARGRRCRRPVTLQNLYLIGDKTSERLHLLPTLVDLRPNPEASRLDEEAVRGARFADHPKPLLGAHDVLNLTLPDEVRRIHEAYLLAGADIIETNTFNSTSISQADYGTQDLAYELNRVGAELARAAVGDVLAPVVGAPPG